MDKIGKVYGVGVGPGDPELMTLKAVRLIRESTVIAAAGKEIEKSKAYQIARAAVPEIEEKTKLSLPMPMTSDPEMLRKAHEEAVRLMQTFLDQGISVAYITLGDPTIYCTFSYLQHFLEILLSYNISLAVFNLVPVPPLDGYRLVNQIFFRGNLDRSMNPQTMQIIHFAFLFVCLSGVLSTAFSRVCSFFMINTVNLFANLLF